ncbi:hypothetical protein HK405_013294 [Cladochytrium tenue]|nr:hypothetical protein HK405_013294 [Cladochytrium tenue]
MLARLNLSSVWDITDAGVASLCKALKGLEEIDFSNCRKLTDAAMISVLETSSGVNGSNTLFAVQASYCKNFSDAALTHPTWAIVESVNLHRCTGITDEAFAAWEEAATGRHPWEVNEEDDRVPNYTAAAVSHDNDGATETDSPESHAAVADALSQAIPSLLVSDDLLPLAAPADNLGPLAPPPIRPFVLQELILSDCSFLSDAAVSSIARACPALRVLSLSFCCALTEAFALPLATHSRMLVALDLSYCGAAVTDRSLATLAGVVAADDLVGEQVGPDGGAATSLTSDGTTGLSALERLSLRGCVQITPTGVAAAVEAGLPALRRLNASQCRNLRPPDLLAALPAASAGRLQLVTGGSILDPPVQRRAGDGGSRRRSRLLRPASPTRCGSAAGVGSPALGQPSPFLNAGVAAALAGHNRSATA